jgi:hypothetical protein
VLVGWVGGWVAGSMRLCLFPHQVDPNTHLSPHNTQTITHPQKNAGSFYNLQIKPSQQLGRKENDDSAFRPGSSRRV